MSASIYNNKAGISKVLCIFFMIDERIIMINEGEPYYIYFHCVLTKGTCFIDLLNVVKKVFNS